jgi:ATP-dependent RNA helicase DDX24/MAK5
MVAHGPKRKVQTNSSDSRKRPKTQHRTADGLPWKTVLRPSEAGFGGDDGILELEEVEGVEVIYEDTDGGRVVKFNVGYIENSSFRG